MEEGVEKGIARGEEQMLMTQIRKKLSRGKNASRDRRGVGGDRRARQKADR